MAEDLIAQSAVFNYKRYRLPSFGQVKQILESPRMSEDLLQLAAPTLVSSFTEQSEEKSLRRYLDAELRLKLEEVLKKVPKESFVYNYLALSLDFRKIQQLYMEFFERDKTELQKSLLQLSSKLILKDVYLPYLFELNKKLKPNESFFEYVTRLDAVFFQFLKSISLKKNESVRNFVDLKIAGYNFTAYVRLKELNKNPEDIRSFLVPLASGNVPSVKEEDIKKLVETNLDERAYTPDVVEKAVQVKILKFLKSAAMSADTNMLLLLYIETIKNFFYDLKLIAIADEVGSDREDTRRHLINYDLK